MLLSWYGRHKVLVWVVTGLFVLYLLAGFVAVPLVIHHVLRNQATAALHRNVQATSIRANPFAFSVRISELSISDRDDSPFVRVEDLYINVDPLLSLFKWGAAVHSMEISNPRVRIVRTGEDQFNFSDLIVPSQKEAAKEPEKASPPLRFVLGLFKLDSGEIQFIDNSQGMPFETTVSGLNLNLAALDTKPEAEAFSYSLKGRTEADERLEINGWADILPLAAEADVAVKGLTLSKYAPYYQPHFNAKIADGRIDLRAKIQWSDQSRTASDLVLAVANLALKDFTGVQTLATLPRFKVEGAAIDLKDRRIRLGRIDSHDAQVNIQRSSQGRVNLVAAFTPRFNGESRPGDPLVEQKETAPEPAWQILVPELNLDNYTINFEDLQPELPARISLHQIALAAQNLSTQEQAQGKVNLQMQWADQGTLSAQGDIGLVPLHAVLDVAAKSVDIRLLQPYLKQFVQMVVTKGEFDSQGQLKIVPKEASVDIEFSGQASLNGFESVDADRAALFSKWKSLYLKGIDLGTTPLRVGIAEVALTDFYNRLMINADGTANIQTIFGARRSPAEPQKQAERMAPAGGTAQGDTKHSSAQTAGIRVKTVTLQGGEVDFSDLHVKPNVRLAMKNLGGRISGLDNVKENKADVLLHGTVGSNIPMEIKGQVNPLIDKPFVDLDLTFPAIDLSPFGPYSGKYLGYELDKGQLAFVLSYKVIDNKLTGKNKIQINQLTFGDSVASPQATKLPIRLAVALLKDRQGNIDLDLPVTGDLDDPEFSIGGIVLKMFVNLIVEIVSSPFKMLGAIFGGGQELSYLDFDPGQSMIAPERVQKLDTLAKILYERPGLNLEIQGQVDPQKDTDGLRQLRFEENLKAAKLKAMVAAGRQALPLDRIEITPQERNLMIQEAFKAATFPKPRDEKGQLKKLDPLEMEKLLYTAVDISADDLRRLAYQRATAAKEYLITTGQIEARRLFVTEPEIENTAQKELKPQVEFNLK